MKAITYRITLLEPTLITGLEGDPNTAVSFDYLPGSTLRGALIGKYLRAHQLATTHIKATDPDIRRLFFDGTTRYLNGYVVDPVQDRRTLPTPLSWQHEKYRERKIYDFAVDLPPPGNQQWQGTGKPFCLLTDGGVRFMQPDRHISVHTARTRRYGRAMRSTPDNPLEPSDNPGAVYRYDALAGGQTFEAVILYADNDSDEIISWLTGEGFLGRGRSGGYGRVMFTVVKEQEAMLWCEAVTDSESEPDTLLIVTLLSDALLRNDYGQFVVDPEVVTQVLSKALGNVPLTLHKDMTFMRGREVGGFNRKWGLPLTQTVALQMGSVLVFDKPNCSQATLAHLVAEGIGERRAEGFGRVAVNWHMNVTLTADESRPNKPLLRQLIPGTPGATLAQRMAERLLRQQLDERIVARTNPLAIINPPSPAQLSRLRGVLQTELAKTNPEAQCVAAFLKSVHERRVAARQFERARIEDQRLSDWLDYAHRSIAEEQWKSLLGIKPKDFRKIGGIQASLSEALRIEYVLRFIDAVLARSLKSQRSEGD